MANLHMHSGKPLAPCRSMKRAIGRKQRGLFVYLPGNAKSIILYSMFIKLIGTAAIFISLPVYIFV